MSDTKAKRILVHIAKRIFQFLLAIGFSLLIVGVDKEWFSRGELMAGFHGGAAFMFAMYEIDKLFFK